MHRTNLKGVDFNSSVSKMRKLYIMESPAEGKFFKFFFRISGLKFKRGVVLG